MNSFETPPFVPMESEPFIYTNRSPGCNVPSPFGARARPPSPRAYSLQDRELSLLRRQLGYMDHRKLSDHLPATDTPEGDIYPVFFNCQSHQRSSASTAAPGMVWDSLGSLSLSMASAGPLDLLIENSIDDFSPSTLPSSNALDVHSSTFQYMANNDDETYSATTPNLENFLDNSSWLDALQKLADTSQGWVPPAPIDIPIVGDDSSLVIAAKRHKEVGSVRLFVGRIPKSLRGRDLRELFQQFGPVVDCNIICDRATGESKGCGFVRMADLVSACRAASQIYQKNFVNSDVGPLQVKFASGELKRLHLPDTFQPGGDCIKVFVGNLASSTSENTLMNCVREFGQVEEVCILPTTRGSSRPSRSSGFVTFQVFADAVECINQMDKKIIPELNSQKPIEVRLAESKAKRARRLAETKRRVG